MYEIDKCHSVLNVAIGKPVYLARKRDRGKKTLISALALSQTFGKLLLYLEAKVSICYILWKYYVLVQLLLHIT